MHMTRNWTSAAFMMPGSALPSDEMILLRLLMRLKSRKTRKARIMRSWPNTGPRSVPIISGMEKATTIKSKRFHLRGHRRWARTARE